MTFIVSRLPVCYNGPVIVSPLLPLFGVVLAETTALYLVSEKVLFTWVIGAFAAHSRGPYGGCILAVMRLPGNFLHELSHAVAYLLLGYRVRAFCTCFGDPDGRGFCLRGERWGPHGVPLVAAASAALMPFLTGIVALYWLARGLGIELPPADGNGSLAGMEGWPDFPSQVLAFLEHLDFGRLDTWLFGYLALSIGAELSPSPTDLRRGAPGTLVLLLILSGWLLAYPNMNVPPAWREWTVTHLGALLRSVSSLLLCALVATTACALPLALVAAVVRSVRAEGTARPHAT